MQSFQIPRIKDNFCMFLLRSILCFAILSTSAHKVLADSDGIIRGNESWYYVNKTKRFVVELYDNVSDGCWVNTNSSENSVELEIIRSGGEIVEENIYGPLVEIGALGYETSPGSCAVYVDIRVRNVDTGSLASEDRKILTIFRANLWREGSLLTGSKSGMSRRIQDQHINLIRGFLVDLDKNANLIEARVLEEVDDAHRDYWVDFFLDETGG